MLQHLNRISYNIDMLAEYLNNIEESILLTKLQSIPNYFLTKWTNIP